MTKPDRKGPCLDEKTIQWLDQGGPFPPELVLTTLGPNGETFSHRYEILERDQNGFISALRQGRRGKKGFVLKVKEALAGRQMAAKLTLRADYEGSTPLQEMNYAARLGGAEGLIHLPENVGSVEHFTSEPESDDKRPWVCFLSSWLPGRTIAEIIADNKELITAADVANIARELLTAVLFFERRGLKHDDLHLGNLMLVDPDPDLVAVDPSRKSSHLRVIDIGSVKDINRETNKDDDDWSSVARCLAELHNVLNGNRLEATRYPEFMRLLRNFIQALADEDQARHFPSPEDYLGRIRDAAATITLQPRSKGNFSPFDAISAEHLASDTLLLQLFVDCLPWIQLVSKNDPCLLYGPRGCGKSMVFRYLSARTHITSPSVPVDKLKEVGFFGVYIGCASDLGNDLQWLARESGRPRRKAQEITSYFNLVLARELFRSLAACGQAPAIMSYFGVTVAAKRTLADFLEEQCGNALDMIRVAGSDQLQSCVDALDRLRLKLGRGLVSETSEQPVVLQPTFIRDLCREIVRLMPMFREHRITFLLDDFTRTRLHPEVQQILNVVVWQRDSSFAFKVSSEPYGFDTTHHDGAQIDANREFAPIDAGALTLGNERRDERRAFITELLNKRLEAAKFKGTAEQLIGESACKEDTELAWAIRGTEGETRAGKKSHYHGLHVLSDAWSADVSTVLHIVREMFARANVGPQTVEKVKPEVQHESIVKISTGMRARVQGFHPYGDKMHQIMSAFGDTAAKLLVEGTLQRVGKHKYPQRRYRIEMSLPPGSTFDGELMKFHNGQDLTALRKELIRRGVFHEHPESRGKESAAHRTVRWELRTSLLPSFNTSLIRRDYIDIKRIEDFVEFLTSPKVYMEKVWLRYGRGGELFDDDEGRLL